MKLRTTLMRDTGATLSPFHSFLLLQGLETLSLRVERHVENALKVVDYLKNHPMVKKVNHPSQATGKALELYNKYYPNGGASIFTFELNGTKEQAQKFTESLEDLLAAGKRRRREISGDSSGIYDPFADD